MGSNETRKGYLFTMIKLNSSQEMQAPQGYSPLSRSEERYKRTNPDSKVAHAAAIRTVILQIVTEAFDLYDEERLWLGYHLDNLFAPLLELSPHAVPLPVRQEMLDGTYTRLLELRNIAKKHSRETKIDKKVLQASAEEWVEVLLSPVFSSYQLRPLTESSMRGQMLGLLNELGIDDPETPRPATFLPNDLRLEVLSRKDF
jgi:hypothetical protein